MPNPNNIESPITLVAFGRSGTSLLSKIFDHYPGCQSVNETVNLIFDTWQAIEEAAPITAPFMENGIRLSTEEQAGRAVRQIFLSCFPDEQPFWFQKPITPPRALSAKFPGLLNKSRWDEAAIWYWEVMARSFPDAKYFTILRHPCDIVLSAQVFWGADPGDTWTQLGFMAHLLTHPASPVEYAIHYEELVQNKGRIVQDLFTFLELPFHEQVLEAFSQLHGASEKKGNPQVDSTTRAHDRDQLDSSKATSFQIEHLTKLFAKFGYSLKLPAKFKEGSLSKGRKSQETPEQIIQRLRQVIRNINVKNAAQMRRLKEQEKQMRELKAQIQQRAVTVEQMQKIETGFTVTKNSQIWQTGRIYQTIKNKLLNGIRFFRASSF